MMLGEDEESGSRRSSSSSPSLSAFSNNLTPVVMLVAVGALVWFVSSLWFDYKNQNLVIQSLELELSVLRDSMHNIEVQEGNLEQKQERQQREQQDLQKMQNDISKLCPPSGNSNTQSSSSSSSSSSVSSSTLSSSGDEFSLTISSSSFASCDVERQKNVLPNFYTINKGKALDNRLPIFLHNHKAGGSTMKLILLQVIFSNQLAFTSVLNPYVNPSVIKMTAPDQAKLRLLYGGYSFGIHDDLKPNPRLAPVAYFGMMRDPVDRAISDYFYFRTHPRDVLIHDGWAGPNNASILEYSEFQGNHFLRLLNLREDYHLRHRVSRRHLIEAKQNIESWFTVVGLTEHFAETLVLLKHTFGWKELEGREVELGGRTRNKNTKTVEDLDRNALTEHELAKIAEYNSLDIELYEHWKALFYKQIEKASPEIQRDILKVREQAQSTSLDDAPPKLVWNGAGASSGGGVGDSTSTSTGGTTTSTGGGGRSSSSGK